MRSCILLAGLILSGCGERAAEPAVVEAGLEVYSPAAVSPVSDLASVYFGVVNRGTTDTLVAVDVGELGVASIHTMLEEGGAARMVPVELIEIAAGTGVQFRPGSYHVMLNEVTRGLSSGDTIVVSLRFAKAGSVDVATPVLTYSEMIESVEALSGSGAIP